MPDSPPTSSSEGGVTVRGGRGPVNITGDVVGRDKTIIEKIIFNLFSGGQRDSLERRNRRAMLDRVKNDWIKGFLEQSLDGASLIQLRMEYKPKTVQPSQPLSLGTKIAEIFDQASGELLILGEPGSGKTTMLLDLVRDLIARAEQDEMQPIPVVFKLSSWAEKRPLLTKWLAEELSFYFGIRKKIATGWVKDNYVLPLLDGLDEVKPEYRAECVEAINRFRQEHGLLPMVVCSRSADYEALNNQLWLRGAIILQPLTREQIDHYLARAGEQLASLRTLLRDDAALQELAESPLMLSIMARTYKETPVSLLTELKTVEAQRKHLFDTYAQKMFEHRSSGERYDPLQVIHWLSWLARRMVEHNQTTFYLERMQPNWLQSQRWRYTMVIAAVFGLVFMLASRLVFGSIFGLVGMLGIGLLPGLSLGLLFGLAEIRTVETLNWSWSKANYGLIGGMIFGLMIGLAVGLVGWLTGRLVIGLILGLIVWLFFGLFFGLSFGLLFGLKAGKEIETKSKPNQGIWRSAQNAILAGAVGSLGVGPVIGLVGALGFRFVFGLAGWPIDDRLLVGQLVNGFVSGLYVGLFMGLLFAFSYGGGACIQHIALRFLLYRNGAIPRGYIRFLDYCAERIFLRKVGGGYIFVHRLLMEYFAGLGSLKR